MPARPVNPGRDDPVVKCPRHRHPMRRFDIDGVPVDRCGICGGIWLDLGEIRRLLELGPKATHAIAELDRRIDPDDISAGTPPVCPRDTTPLTQVRDPKQPHIEYDLCTHCGGVFFDAGELHDLTEFTLRERLLWMFPGLGRAGSGQG